MCEGQLQCEIPEDGFCRSDLGGPGGQRIGVLGGRGCPSAWGNWRVWEEHPAFPFGNESCELRQTRGESDLVRPASHLRVTPGCDSASLPSAMDSELQQVDVKRTNELLRRLGLAQYWVQSRWAVEGCFLPSLM